jgi:hypothetical protein
LRYLVLSLLLTFSSGVFANNKLTTDQLSGFVGKNVTVCGKVVEITTNNRDTFINLDKPHPHQNFYFYANNQTISFNRLFKNVCGTGILKTHKGKYQIIISDLKSLSFN